MILKYSKTYIIQKSRELLQAHVVMKTNLNNEYKKVLFKEETGWNHKCWSIS